MMHLFLTVAFFLATIGVSIAKARGGHDNDRRQLLKHEDLGDVSAIY